MRFLISALNILLKGERQPHLFASLVICMSAISMLLSIGVLSWFSVL